MQKILKKVEKIIKAYSVFFIKKIKKFFMQIFKRIKKFLNRGVGYIPNFFVRNYKSAVALVLVVAVLMSSFLGNNAMAATYTFSQESWSGATANTATHTSNRNGWSEYTSLTGAETANGGSDVVLSPASSSFTETFTSTTYKDTGNTTGNWNTSSGQMEMLAASGVNLTSEILGIFGENQIFSSVVVGNELYAGGVGGKFAKYNISTNTATDLTPLISSLMSTATVASMAYDSANGVIYLGGTNRLIKYTISSGVTVNLGQAMQTALGAVATTSILVDSVNGAVYFGGTSSRFYKYTISSNTFVDLTSKISAFWASGSVSSLALDNTAGTVYLGGSGKFAAYSISGNTATDKTSKISSFWGANIINALVFESVGSEVYLGGQNGKFAKYNAISDTATDKTSKISSFWFNATIQSLALDSVNSVVYMVGATSVNFAKYTIGTDTATDLKTLKNNGIQTGNQGHNLAIDLSGGNVFISGAYGTVTKYNISSNTFSNLSSSGFSNFFITLPSLKFAYDSENNVLYFADNVTDNFVKYNISTGEMTNLTAILNSALGGSTFNEMDAILIDQAGENIYVGGMVGCFDEGCSSPSYLFKYNISSNTASATRVAWDSAILSLTEDTQNNVIYGGLNQSQFFKYSVSGGVVTDLTSQVNSLWVGQQVKSLAYDSTNSVVYLVAGPKFGVYSISGNTIVDKTSKISSFWGANLINTLVFELVGSDVYLAGSGGKFAKYNAVSDTATDLTLTISSFWLTSVVDSLMSDSSSGSIYLGGPTRLARYSVVLNSATNLYSQISSFWSNSIQSFGLNPTNGNIYFSGTSSKLGYLTSGCGATCYAYSTAVDSTPQAITSATLTKNDTSGATYFLSNDGGVTYSEVTPGVAHVFATTGSDLRFKISLTGSATVQDVSITYNYLSPTGSLVSSVYDSEDAGNVMGGISWVEDATLPAGTGVTLSLRTASSVLGIAAAPWTDFSNGTFNCEKVDTTVSCPGSTIPQAMKSGGDDRYFQYQITLTSTGANTPTVGSVTTTYVVNARPEFDVNYPDPENPGTGSIASQVVNQESENLGKVFIQYSVRDTDTSLGSITPGFVTPSFEYNTGSGWATVDPSYLRQADTENKSVDALNFTEYSALWDAKAQIPEQYSATARIRVTINDNEGANNTATSETPTFVLDTTNPAISSFVINSATDTISLTGTDDTNLQYRLANVADYSDAGEWVDVGSNILDVDTAGWNIIGAPGEENVYVQIRDIYGNITAGTATAPVTIQNLDLRDVGNIQTGEFREFLTWGLYQAGANTAFTSYEIYRSTNGTDYALLASISDINQNYYTDSGLSNLNTYYYKIEVIDTDGDHSNYSAIVSDTPDGQGGTDFTAPSISDVDVAEVQTTWVKINWTTDEISDSVVEYSVAPSTAFNLSKTSTALVNNHSIVVDGLTPNTDYLFRVRSTDFLSNTGTDDNSGAGHSFSTAGGPAISGVAVRSVDDNTATIVWNTDRSANSYVVFAGEISDLETGTNINTVGSAEFVQDPFEHQVVLTDLISKSTYYFYVKSTDEQSGYESIDNRSGSFYTFNTTNDQKAPTISNIATPVITPNAASITWMTDELADSLVEYGTAVDTYDNSSSLDSTMSIYHVITLNGLEVETPYYIRVKSNDSAGNSAEATSSFITIPELNTVYVSSGGGGGSAKDTTPPKISDIEVKDETSFSAVVSFATDEDTTGFVNFGEDVQYGKTIGSSTFATNHEIKMFGLRSGTTYNFEIKVFDKGGNMSAATNRTFTTKFASEMVDELVMLDNIEEFQSKIEGIIESTLPSLIPPVISDIEVTNVSDTSADVSWKTNVKSFGVIALVKGDRFDITSENPYEFEMSNIEEKVKDHKLTLQSLEPGTKYNFQVRSFSIPGVVGKSKDYNFATRAPNAKAGAVKTTNNSFTISWQTADATTSFVEYKNLKTGKVAEIGNKELTKNHIIEVVGLPGATTFEVTYFGHTADGVKIEGSSIRVTTQIDNKAPAISDVSISSAFIPYRPNQLQTLISWKTDEPANSIVEYEEGPGSADELANKLGEEEEYTKEHIVVLPGFKPGTIYRVKITSSDMAGNDGLVPTRTIITPVATDSVFEIIINNFEDVFGFLKNVR